MSLLKRRSRSETRKFQLNEKGTSSQGKVQLANIQKEEAMAVMASRKQQSHTHLNQLGKNLELSVVGTAGVGLVGGMGRRKTSAELISEAKTLLLVSGGETTRNGAGNHAAMGRRLEVGGVRLVSTRRPITPRETGRALYGKVALAGRPPSAFSMRYLRNEGNRTPMTPALEPIRSTNTNNAAGVGGDGAAASNKEELFATPPQPSQRVSRRSHSLESRYEFHEIAGVGDYNNVAGLQTTKAAPPRKLPALEMKGVAVPALAAKSNNNELANTVGGSKARRSRTAQHTHSLDLNVAESSSNSNSTSMTNENSFINVLTSRKLLCRNYDLLAQSSTEKLIELLKEHAGLKDCANETVNHVNSILLELYERVRKHEKSFKRGFILGGLYGLVECSSPKILLAVARVVLALRVTGSNLTGACKLVFKVSRNEQNDHLFHDNDLLELLIDGLGRASPLDDPEACIYGYGSIRFLTSSTGQERAESSAIKDVNKNWSECLVELPRKPATAPPGAGGGNKFAAFEQLQRERIQKLSKQNSLVDRLARHGAVELMVLHLQILNEVGATKKLAGPPLHSLYQLSAALRALADVRQTSYSFEQDLDWAQQQRQRQPTSTDAADIQLELACPHLIRAAEISIGELEVQANIVRTLSVLSEDNDCCFVLVNYTARIAMLLGPCCEIFSGSAERLLSLFSRLGYILGNILAKYDSARVQFYHNDVAMECLLNVLELYSQEPLTMRNAQGDTVIDVLIKMIRVVANMSVSSEVGFGLGNSRALGAMLLNLLNASNQGNPAKMKSELQELAHATLGALHNLCFYQDKNTTPAQVIDAKGSLQSVLSDLATALCATLRTSKDDVATQVETARVLGNLTRNERARKYFCRAGGLPLVVKHLAHNSEASQDYDLKACAIGVLVNLLGDWENRAPFMQLGGADLLRALLRDALQQADWFVAAIICQAFWNLLIDTSSQSPMNDNYSEHILDDICDLLADYLDEERLFEGNSETADVLWENFAVVATDLLERIQTNYEKESSGGGGEEPSIVSLETSDVDNIDDEDDVYIEEM